MKTIYISALLMCLTLGVMAQSLTKSQSNEFSERLISKRQSESVSKFGIEWKNKELKNGEFSMKFDYTVFGEKPVDGRAMYISMHGGGSTTQEMNDGQWNNQKKLYTPSEGVYFVPRSPSDTWNMWHQEYMDIFIEKAIELAIIEEGVNPNKVYIMGYSAGGDGTYQLAPRLADLWAGAAMSAGHPGDAQIESLRNLPFALYMGAQDAPYNRNGLARQWGIKHDSLASADKGAYIHDVKIYEQHGHWMKRDDSVSMAWLPQFKRNPIPNKVVWVQDDVIRNKFYWLEATDMGKKQGDKIVATYSEGRVDILEATPSSFIISLNDKMMNLDKPVSVYYNGNRIFKGKVVRTKTNIENDIKAMRDTDLIFPAKLRVHNNKTVEVCK